MECPLALRQHLESRAKGRDVGAGDTATLQPDKVKPVQDPTRRLHQTVGDHVIRHHRHSADDGPATDTHELVDTGQPADQDIVFNDAVARDGGVVHNNHPIAKDRIMGDVTARHKQPVIADPGHAATAFGAAVHGDMFADTVAFANLQTAGFPFELKVLGDFTDHREGKDHRTFADFGVAGDDRVGLHLNVVMQHDPRADDAERADLGRGRDLRPFLDHGAWVDVAHQDRSIIAVNSTSAAISPSTEATPPNFQTLPPGLPRRVFSSIRTTSPGTTLRRNLHLSMAMK